MLILGFSLIKKEIAVNVNSSVNKKKKKEWNRFKKKKHRAENITNERSNQVIVFQSWNNEAPPKKTKKKVSRKQFTLFAALIIILNCPSSNLFWVQFIRLFTKSQFPSVNHYYFSDLNNNTPLLVSEYFLVFQKKLKTTLISCSSYHSYLFQKLISMQSFQTFNWNYLCKIQSNFLKHLNHRSIQVGWKPIGYNTQLYFN